MQRYLENALIETPNEFGVIFPFEETPGTESQVQIYVQTSRATT